MGNPRIPTELGALSFVAGWLAVELGQSAGHSKEEIVTSLRGLQQEVNDILDKIVREGDRVVIAREAYDHLVRAAKQVDGQATRILELRERIAQLEGAAAGVARG